MRKILYCISLFAVQVSAQDLVASPAATAPEVSTEATAPEASAPAPTPEVSASATTPESTIAAAAPPPPPPQQAQESTPESKTAEPAAQQEEAFVKIKAKAGEGVTFSDASGLFELNIRTRLMFLATTEVSDDANGIDFTVRRARVGFSGSAFDPRLRYKLMLAVAPADIQENASGVAQRSPLLDAFIEVNATRDLRLKLGQFVVRHNRSRVTSSSSMQLVDRSIANGEFNLDRDVGIEINSNDLGGFGLFRYALYLGVGEGRDSLTPLHGGGMALARVETTPLGPFADYAEGDLARVAAPRLAFGGSWAYANEVQLDRTTLGTADPDGSLFSSHNVAVDAVFAYAGIWATAEMMWRDATATAPSALSRSGFGGYTQVGCMLPWVDIDVAARVGFLAPLKDSPVKDEREAGVGANWYVFGHAVKLQADLFHIWSADADFGSGVTRARLMTQASF